MLFDALVFRLCIIFVYKCEMKCVLIQFPVTVLKILNIYTIFICIMYVGSITMN